MGTPFVETPPPARGEDIASASSFVLVLEPLASDDIWGSIVAQAAATVQLPMFARTLPDLSARASLELGLAPRDARLVVVGAEGFGRPFGRSSLAVRTRAVATAVRSLPVGRRCRPPIASLWFDVGAQRFLAFRLDVVTGTFTEVPFATLLPEVAAAGDEAAGVRVS
jgi:hypothetical protein